jgi:hypothetical protein
MSFIENNFFYSEISEDMTWVMDLKSGGTNVELQLGGTNKKLHGNF